MSTRPSLLESSRLGWLFVLIVALPLALAILRGLTAWQAAALHVVALSLLAYILFAWDKGRAASSKRRVSEASLWIVALLGGALGAWIAMRQWRHKTRHASFRILVPLALLIHVAAVVLLAGV